MSTGMGSHQTTGIAKDEWLTPPELLKALGEFDLDPCAASEPRPWPTAKTHYSQAEGGLIRPWHGRVWCNPPYGNAGQWLQMMAHHNHGTALIFARTETAAFQSVWQHASALLFLEGRLNFHHLDGRRAAANAGAPSVLIAYGAFDAMMLARSGLPGSLVTVWQQKHAGTLL